MSEYNSYVKQVSDKVKIIYNKTTFVKLELKTNYSVKNYNLSLTLNQISLSETDIKTGSIKDTNSNNFKYQSKDCYKLKCRNEEDYIGYLIFLKDKINSYEKNV